MASKSSKSSAVVEEEVVTAPSELVEKGFSVIDEVVVPSKVISPLANPTVATETIKDDLYAGYRKAKVLVERTSFRAIPWSDRVEYELYYQGWVPWFGYVDQNGQPLAFDGSAGDWVDPLVETVRRVYDMPQRL